MCAIARGGARDTHRDADDEHGRAREHRNGSPSSQGGGIYVTR